MASKSQGELIAEQVALAVNAPCLYAVERFSFQAISIDNLPVVRAGKDSCADRR